MNSERGGVGEALLWIIGILIVIGLVAGLFLGSCFNGS